MARFVNLANLARQSHRPPIVAFVPLVEQGSVAGCLHPRRLQRTETCVILSFFSPFVVDKQSLRQPVDGCGGLANLARQSFAHFFVCSVVHSSCLGFSVANRQFDCGCCAATATSLATDSAERQTSRADQLGSVGKEVIFTVDEEVFVAVRRHGRMCTEKGLWLACESASDSTVDVCSTTMLWFSFSCWIV